jgi:hypothetical protein
MRKSVPLFIQRFKFKALIKLVTDDDNINPQIQRLYDEIQTRAKHI